MGCPQVNVLGPLLWNILFDRALKKQYGEKVDRSAGVVVVRRPQNSSWMEGLRRGWFDCSRPFSITPADGYVSRRRL